MWWLFGATESQKYSQKQKDLIHHGGIDMQDQTFHDEFYRDRYKVLDLDKKDGDSKTLREYMEQFRDCGYYDSDLDFDSMTDNGLNVLVHWIDYLESK